MVECQAIRSCYTNISIYKLDQYCVQTLRQVLKKYLDSFLPLISYNWTQNQRGSPNMTNIQANSKEIKALLGNQNLTIYKSYQVQTRKLLWSHEKLRLNLFIYYVMKTHGMNL